LLHHCSRLVTATLFCGHFVPSLLQLSEAVRDAKLALLKELKPDQPEEAAAAEDIIAELLAEAPTHLPLLLEIMKR
jgi:Xaa-Pro aminopeptidase